MLLEHYECTVLFIGDESSLNHLREKISEMIKTKQKDCIQFLLEKKFDEEEEVDYLIEYETSVYCGYALDHGFDEFEFHFKTNSIILKFETSCLFDTLPYFSELCVKYKVDCQMACRCEFYELYNFYILYRNGKGRHRIYYSLTEGAYMLDPSSIYDKIKDDLMYDIRKNQINLNIKDIYLKRYKYLKENDKEWMSKLIDDIIASYSDDILFRSTHYEERRRGY